MSIPIPSQKRLALVALVCLLVVAAALRFYDLPEHSLRYDEAVAAANSSGSLAEVVSNTHTQNSSPILYPLALWVVQKVDVSAFSIRLLPAMASVLTVGAMLFLLPRVGVSRWAAFIAALLATLSVAAIEHAQDAREYSIDALLAVLMIAGLLWYLRDGRKGLLSATLFVAPLLQYGLVLFGIAVMGAALILPPPPSLAGPERDSYRSRVRNWLKARIPLVWPAACFLAGCAVSYAATLRYNWKEGGIFGADGYLAAYYYQGGFDASAIFEFALDGIWRLLTYHLPEAVALAAIPVFTFLLVAVFLRKLQAKILDRAIAVIFLLCIAVSAGAALLGIYPLGDIRQVIYFGPIIFLAAGVAVHATAANLAGLLRWTWLIPALTIAAAGAIALAGVSDIRLDSPYQTRENTKAVISFLEERIAEDDFVFVTSYAAPVMKFYQGEKPRNYFYSKVGCRDTYEQCNREMVSLVDSLPNVPNKVFLVYRPRTIRTVPPDDAGSVPF